VLRGEIRSFRGALAVAGAAAVALVATGCGGGEPDLVAGKQMFVEKCGSCHTLGRAETKGVSGPNLDDAFRQPLREGFGRNGVEGMVLQQIEHPARVSKENPIYMPPNLVTGDDARDVAAYVAEVTAKPGKDQGILAEAVEKPGGGKPAVARNGVLEIRATAQLAFETNAATSKAGQVELRSPNPSDTPHNIALEGPGLKAILGKVVTGGAVSTVRATVKKGQYTFFCSVPGHREGGMLGKLTVR
jgi:mono/diheme cytochrome c family protein